MIRRFFSERKPLPAGAYHYQAPPDASFPYRLHLRLEADGSGLLIVNAATVLHLNQTAAEYAYHLVNGTSKEEVAQSVSQRYRVHYQQALDDYNDLVERLQTMIATPDLDPEAYLGFDRAIPYSHAISAPYRLDCALTYRLAPGSAPEAAPIERVKHELTVDEWKAILVKAWEVGIPHVIFTGGEPTLREDLPDLIACAEANGQVSGLLSDGLRMADPAYLTTLLQTGLDHIMVVLNPENDQSWIALANLLAADIFVAVHLTLTHQNIAKVPDLMQQLADKGLKALSLSHSDPDLHQTLQSLRDQAAKLGLSLIWDLPVPYSASHPLALELAEQAEEPVPQGAGKAWIYVEPDGDVLPSQGINQVLGNFLSDPWEKIWKPVEETSGGATE